MIRVWHSDVLARSYAECRRVVKQAGSTFPVAFRLLPRDQRLAMDSLYAWLRITDDLADDDGTLDALQAWRRDTFSDSHHPILPAFRDTIARFHIPVKYFHDLLDGVESDLAPRLFGSFDALEPYCYRVAGTVGLACCAIWGATGEFSKPAIAAGTAFQLTNILRDVGEDRARGRCYLPVDDFQHFGTDFRSLVRFESERARGFYRASDPLVPLLPRPGRRMFLAMRGLYEALLAEVERHPEAVLTRRLRVNRLRKIWILAGAAITPSSASVPTRSQTVHLSIPPTRRDP